MLRSKTAKHKKINKKAFIVYFTCLVVTANVCASDQEQKINEPISNTPVEIIQVTAALGSLPDQHIDSIFGFGKTLLETPRSASTISDEQLERFNIADIDELVAFAPGTFTQSFFGVAGSLDVRGTPGETYFRGIRRLDNPGNYPTPIGASSRIDIIRGPASPIYGPSKIGGYLNFTPKSARANSGQYLDRPTGAVSLTTGTWDKRVLTAEVGAPTQIGEKDLGFYVYAEAEDSGSYYQNTETKQTILQASFNIDLNDQFRIEFGGMYHDFNGNQVAGWNRLTQDLIDSGTYITGSPRPLDTDGDGFISHQEYAVVRSQINPFIADPQNTNSDFFASAQGLENVGVTQLDGSQVLVSPDDTLENKAITLYFDAFYQTSSNWTISNQLFYDSYDNLNENAYGFSQFHDSFVIEDKIVFATERQTQNLTTKWQISPSVRITNFEHADDFTDEYFDRRDLTGPSTSLDRRLLATRIGRDYNNYAVGDYVNWGIATLTDLSWDVGLNALLGLRYDIIDIDTTSRGDLLLVPTDIISASDTEEGISWSASISYHSPFGLTSYITAAQQSTIIAGQGAEITVSRLGNGAFDTSDLFEFGIKGSFLNNSLYLALSLYQQERSDFNAQAINTNATTKNEGTEFELRWAVTEQLLLSVGYTNLEVENLTSSENGFQFGFLGAEDFDNLDDPSILFGGAATGLNLVDDGRAIKAGIPENIYSATATYEFTNGLALNASVVHADGTFSGFSRAVKLPAYTLVNTGIFYTFKDWAFSVNIKNLTDERYFRANFPDLFGSQIVLPELPRHYQAKINYTF